MAIAKRDNMCIHMWQVNKKKKKITVKNVEAFLSFRQKKAT